MREMAEYYHTVLVLGGETEIEAIFVFTDSGNWARDQQIILDLPMSMNGRLSVHDQRTSTRDR